MSTHKNRICWWCTGRWRWTTRSWGSRGSWCRCSSGWRSRLHWRCRTRSKHRTWDVKERRKMCTYTFWSCLQIGVEKGYLIYIFVITRQRKIPRETRPWRCTRTGWSRYRYVCPRKRWKKIASAGQFRGNSSLNLIKLHKYWYNWWRYPLRSW